MEYAYDVWYLFALLVIFGLFVGCIYLVRATANFVRDEWQRHRKNSRRKARLRERARRAQASAGKPPVRSPFVSRKTRYLIQHREGARRAQASAGKPPVRSPFVSRKTRHLIQHREGARRYRAGI